VFPFAGESNGALAPPVPFEKPIVSHAKGAKAAKVSLMKFALATFADLA
jgi:hypothetical protein